MFYKVEQGKTGRPFSWSLHPTLKTSEAAEKMDFLRLLLLFWASYINIEAVQQPPATVLSGLGPFLLKSQGQEDASVLASQNADKDNNKAPEELSRVSDLDLQPRQGDVDIEATSTPNNSGNIFIWTSVLLQL